MAKSRTRVIDAAPNGLKSSMPDTTAAVDEFISTCEPLEQDVIHLLVDARTNARYCECHIKAHKIIELSTIDVPLDPDEQPDYRANREIVEDAVAYQTMKDDAKQRRSFSNIVTEFTRSFDPDFPLKIIGGQHRYNAIKEAFENGIDEYHGVKVYFGLNPDQRLDVQLISNTNIAVSGDLFDRMQETLSGPYLRQWCQEAGLLDPGEDFADKRQRGHQITVKAARTFIFNYYKGVAINPVEFDRSDTTPIICKSGVPDPDWEKTKTDHPNWWSDPHLKKAGEEFALLAQAQRAAFIAEKGKTAPNVDFAEKASNFAVLASWAYVAGVLSPNPKRLERHFSLRNQPNRDPLNAAALAKGRHKSDAENYRGLGYRTDAKERGRFVELFYLQAEKGNGVDKATIDIAIKKYHAKRAILEVLEAEEKSGTK
jgi:hypothetical protein